jgi:AraC family transcriptional regulator of adaptative response/methylated-DNA-[protein]-cysteine methyltransferase
MKTTSKSISAAAVTMADPRWAAVVARDPAADGRFLYSVRTTGVYCRPRWGVERKRALLERESRG